MSPHGAHSNASLYLDVLIKTAHLIDSSATPAAPPLLKRSKPTVVTFSDLMELLRQEPAIVAPQIIDALISLPQTDLQTLLAVNMAAATATPVEMIAIALCSEPAYELKAIMLVTNPLVANQCVKKLTVSRERLAKKIKEWLITPLEVTRVLVGLKDPRLLSYAKAQLMLPPLDGGAIEMSLVLVQRMAVLAAALDGRELAKSQLSVADPGFTSVLGSEALYLATDPE